MKIKKCGVILILLSSIFLTSCWDYAEISDLIPIAGIAVDKDKNSDEYLLTLEVIQPSKDGNSIQSVLLEGRGKTLHEAFRETITTTGSMIGASHASVFIIGKDIVEQGVIPVLDLVDRDKDVRSDMILFVSGEKSAGCIFRKTRDLGEIISYQLAKSLGAQSQSGRYMGTKLYEFVDELQREGVSPSIANLVVEHTRADIVAKMDGTYVFHGDKSVGYLNSDETFFLSFIKGNNKLRCVFPLEMEDLTRVSLEIIDYKKTMNPHIEKDEICFDIGLHMNVLISEVQGEGHNVYLSKDGRGEIKREAEKYIEDNIRKLIEKGQNELETDVFGFGEIIKKKKPKYWNQFKNRWQDEYKMLKVNVSCDVHIRGSSLLNDTIKVGM